MVFTAADLPLLLEQPPGVDRGVPHQHHHPPHEREVGLLAIVAGEALRE
ncbi:MAG: hypothetical protein R2713_12445 [Ilumatobacteraceae bacterium]